MHSPFTLGGQFRLAKIGLVPTGAQAGRSEGWGDGICLLELGLDDESRRGYNIDGCGASAFAGMAHYTSNLERLR
jgi:hypothetical protein